MSGFETRWLDLREPVDHAARDEALRLQAIAHLAPLGEMARVVDLGCGTGSTFRALSPQGRRWRWLLVDNDPLLLGAARLRLCNDADITLAETDLLQFCPEIFDGADLITASALFDLTSAAFVERLAEQIKVSGTGLYAVLNYDGHCRWSAPHPDDAAVVMAFNEHQRGDKGFGPALGPDSGPALKRVLEAAGFRVSIAPSPWRLTPHHADLQREFIDGMALAVSQVNGVGALGLEDWRRTRLARVKHSACEVGHWDILALP